MRHVTSNRDHPRAWKKSSTENLLHHKIEKAFPTRKSSGGTHMPKKKSNGGGCSFSSSKQKTESQRTVTIKTGVNS